MSGAMLPKAASRVRASAQFEVNGRGGRDAGGIIDMSDMLRGALTIAVVTGHSAGIGDTVCGIVDMTGVTGSDGDVRTGDGQSRTSEAQAEGRTGPKAGRPTSPSGIG